ncbi:hypothetical protein Q7P37_007974 [Cladosporium fusiforme]
MEGPQKFQLKRKTDELPPDQLFVERSAKRTQSGSIDEGTRGYYIRQRQEDEHVKSSTEPKAKDGQGDAPFQSALTQQQRREYHLARAAQGTSSRKRKQNDDLATVVEKKQKKFNNATTAATTSLHENSDDSPVPSTPAPTKRPGRGSALRPRTDKAKPDPAKNENVAARQQAELNALAQEMHQFALDELAKTPKPQIKTKPKLTPSRSRALHKEHTATVSPSQIDSQNKEDDDAMDSDSEYVYDTYILAPAPLPTPTAATANDATETPKPLAIPSNVGYLIITEDDEELWENYMHDLGGSDSEPTDEDDENAEDYYGADYPSDELASDDEHDRGAYAYRARRGSNDEQYNLKDGSDNDSDEATWSDEEDFRMMNPFARKSQIPKQFAKYLNRDRAGEGGKADDDED